MRSEKQRRSPSSAKEPRSPEPLQRNAGRVKQSVTRRLSHECRQQPEAGDAFIDVDAGACDDTRSWKPLTKIEKRETRMSNVLSPTTTVNHDESRVGMRHDHGISGPANDEHDVMVANNSSHDFSSTIRDGQSLQTAGDQCKGPDSADSSDDSMLEADEDPRHTNSHDDVLDGDSKDLQPAMRHDPPTPSHTAAKRARLMQNTCLRQEDSANSTERPTTPLTISAQGHGAATSPTSAMRNENHNPAWTTKDADSMPSTKQFKSRPSFGTPGLVHTPDPRPNAHMDAAASKPAFAAPRSQSDATNRMRPKYVLSVISSTPSALENDAEVIRLPSDIGLAFSPHHRKKSRFTNDGWAIQARSWILGAASRCDVPSIWPEGSDETTALQHNQHLRKTVQNNSRRKSAKDVATMPHLAVAITSVLSNSSKDETADDTRGEESMPDGSCASVMTASCLTAAKPAQANLLLVGAHGRGADSPYVSKGSMIDLLAPAWEVPLVAVQDKLDKESETIAEYHSHDTLIVCAAWHKMR